MKTDENENIKCCADARICSCVCSDTEACCKDNACESCQCDCQKTQSTCC